MIKYALGIDLGTTNSCVAIMEGDRPIVIPNKAGYKTTPSMVAVTEMGKRLIGQLAKRQAITNAKNTIYATKRLIGRRMESPELQQSLQTLPYHITEGPNGDIRVILLDDVFSLAEIAAMILIELRVVAEEYLGCEVTQAIITAPAYFNDDQRQATIDAGRIAGLEVLRIINEPTAAALAYGHQTTEPKTLAVYDLGGGTFDVSILKIHDGIFTVLASMGDTFLGGEDFDNRIIEQLVYDFARESGVDLRKDTMATQRLKVAAEKAKCDLSSMQSAEINLPFIWTNENGEALHLNATLQREQFEGLVIDLLRRCIKISKQALDAAGVSVEEIDDVLLVGGMTRMPLVQQSVEEFFGRRASKGINPDEAIALGAAIQANALIQQNSEILLCDVTPLDLGIAIHGGGFHVIVPKNSSVPTTQSTIFTTSSDMQSSLKIIVLQGDSEQAGTHHVLSEFSFSGITPAPAGTVDIEISFNIDVDGIVHVTACDLATKRRHNVSISRSSKLAEDEIQRMIGAQQDYLLKVKKSESQDEQHTQLARLERELQEILSKPLPEHIFEYGQRIIRSTQIACKDKASADYPALIKDLQRAIGFIKPLTEDN
ncbi:MAG: molecular chaperone DnaK [Bradymonadales bacterium]|jgi:molecular chaperone DnaK